MRRFVGAGLMAMAWACACACTASAQTIRDVLPIPPVPFTGSIAENVLDSTPTPPQPTRAPQGAPNVLLFMSDDVGFAMSSAFGGPVPTPSFERLATQGQRYNRFHTAGVCSPSRAALLTGRNPHNAGTGHVSDLAAGYPGYAGFIPPAAATVAQTLRLNGYSTAMFGKHHNVPPGEDSAAGPFDNWPTGLGFEYFYGVVTADADQYRPQLFRGTTRVAQTERRGELLDRRLAEDAIDWVHNQKAAAPDKPFFMYYAPGSTHAPHQAPPEYIERFKGRFTVGWDRMREETWRRQLAMGIIPKGTRLTPRPTAIPAWASLSPAKQAFAARAMEVAAAQLAYQDEQFGRVLAELERMGQLQNTLTATVIGDNGASMEAGPEGTINEISKLSGGSEDPQWMLANTDKLGGPTTYGSYPAGWAWAMNTPLRWGKMYASVLGATRNGMILNWPGHVTHPGAICAQFGHLVDLAPTVLEATKLPAPRTVYGIAQKPMDGQSLLSSLQSCEPDRPRTQYFEVNGKIGLYHDGWFAGNDDGRLTWENLPPTGARPQTQWSLYDLRKDFSQSDDIAARNPERMQEMISLWRQVAEHNHVFPLDHRYSGARIGGRDKGRSSYQFWGKGISTPGNSNPSWAGRSFTLDADIVTAQPKASGVIVALGSQFSGWSLFLDGGYPTFVYAASTNPADIIRIKLAAPLAPGAQKLLLSFKSEGAGKAAAITLSSGASTVQGRVERTFMTPAGLGETLDIGRDLGVPVTTYPADNPAFDGEIPHVSLNFDR